MHLTNEDLRAVRQELCRRDFYYYRKWINKGNIKVGWYQKHVAVNLQKFYQDLVSGYRPKLVIQAPPQHGKSIQIIEFISWLAGMNPDLKTIYTSFSERLGVRANLRLQRIYDSKEYKYIFPDTGLNSKNTVTISGQYLRNREILEYIGCEGYFRNTTVRGSITGEGLDLGVIDDPIKGREEAESQTIRDKTWEWFTDDFFTRFSEHAGLLAILTRWHTDDPIGRLLERVKDVRLLTYPALSEPEAQIMDEDPRQHGSMEPLFPELKSKKFLLERKASSTAYSWSSLYMQNPFLRGGGMFKVEGFKIVDAAPLCTKRVRYWDKAGTQDGGAYTAGVLMGQTQQGQWIVLDVKRKQLSAMAREALIKQTAEVDGKGVKIWIEQEPGSGGKESAEATIRNLAGFACRAERVTGDKETRAYAYSAQVEACNILLLRAEWNKDFIAEHESFPSGKYKDQVDAAAGAFNKLADPGKRAGALF